MKKILPSKECPNFDSCSANKCPLDPDYDLRNYIKSEEKCRAWKSTRRKIGEKYPEILKHQGLTGREWNGERNFGQG